MPVIQKDRMRELARAVQVLTRRRVLVGIPAENAQRDAADGQEINNAQIGYIHEYGAPAANIPARPHMVPGIKAAKAELATVMKRIGQDAADLREIPLQQRKDAIDRGLNQMGLIAVSSIRKMMTAGLTPPLKPATIAARESRNHKGTNPLIETGDYLRHISYVLDVKGENDKGVAPSPDKLNIPPGDEP